MDMHYTIRLRPFSKTWRYYLETYYIYIYNKKIVQRRRFSGKWHPMSRACLHWKRKMNLNLSDSHWYYSVDSAVEKNSVRERSENCSRTTLFRPKKRNFIVYVEIGHHQPRIVRFYRSHNSNPTKSITQLSNFSHIFSSFRDMIGKFRILPLRGTTSCLIVCRIFTYLCVGCCICN